MSQPVPEAGVAAGTLVDVVPEVVMAHHGGVDRAAPVRAIEDVVERIHVIGRCLELLRGRVTAPYQLTARDYDLLAQLFRAGEPYRLTPTRLAAGTAAPATTITSRLDRLGRRGLVARVVDEHDRRSLLAELTPTGVELFRSIAVERERQEAELFGELPPGAVEHLRALLDSVHSSCESRLTAP